MDAITLIPTGNKTYTVYEGWYEEEKIQDGINIKPFANVDLNKNINDEIIPINNNIFQRWKKAENCLSYENAIEKNENTTKKDRLIESLMNITMLKILVSAMRDMHKNIPLHKASNFIPIDKMKYDYRVKIKFDPNREDNYWLTKPNEKSKKFEYENVNFELDEFGKNAIYDNFKLINKNDIISAMPEQSNKINLLFQIIGLSINKRIKLALDEVKNITATPWKTVSKCIDDIGNQIKNIKDNGGRVDTILMSPNTYNKFQFICGISYYNMIITDCDIPDNEVYIYDRSIMTVGDGPLLFRSYSDSNGDITEIWKWAEPKISKNLAETQAVKLTGV